MGIKRIIILILGLTSLTVNGQNAVVVTDEVLPVNKELNVLLMLPFCINAPDEFRVRDRMLEYYEGVEMALKELNKLGVAMNLEVVDSKADSLEVINILSDAKYQSFDLIIGPVFDKEFVEVEKFCAIYNIPLVSPLRYIPNKTGAEYPLINLVTIDSLQYYYTGIHAANAFKKYQVVVVDENNKSIKAFASRNFKKGYEQITKQTCQVIDGKTQTIASVWNGKDSLLVFYTGKGPKSCSHALSQNSNGKWKIAGPIDWIDLDRVDYNVFNDVYFYDSYSVPHNDTAYKMLRAVYREDYGGDPQRYTMIGYDQFQFIVTALAAFNKNFYNVILNKKFNYLHTTFNMVRRGNLIENAGTNLFYYKDYKFYKAYWRY